LPETVPAETLALTLGPSPTWWLNGVAALRLGSWLTIVPVGFYVYVVATRRLVREFSPWSSFGIASFVEDALHELTFWLRDHDPNPTLEDYSVVVDTIPSAGPTARADAQINIRLDHRLRLPVPLFRSLVAHGSVERYVDVLPNHEYELAIYPSVTARGRYSFDLLADCSYHERSWRQPLRRGHQLLVLDESGLERVARIYQTYGGMTIDEAPLGQGMSVRVTGAITPPEYYEKRV